MSPEFTVNETTAGLVITTILFPGIRPDTVRILVEREAIRFTGAFVEDGVGFDQKVPVPQGFEVARASATFQKSVLCVRVPRRKGELPASHSLAE